MKDHSHPEPVKCAHDLAWCEKCQKPYCKACGKEWSEQASEVSETWKKFLQRPEPSPYSPRPVPQWGDIPMDLRPRGFDYALNSPAVVTCTHPRQQ